ncbi:MBL fold metallo-hydrolase [Pseudohoeflea sp. DP4N28-3]|uniref:MBL fold metallo-hydrolase n=1 Tax=Pseudohoeflea coraliihabitans TaxID=2860393 RepID=A0ABS6WQM9_9HYPH|nr:MBL fold metallo-hydrolase [Pseudohoeflea sp. DP4N28-3]
MSGDRLVLLGTKGGPAIRPGGPSPTASLLEIGGRRIVIDCGLGVARGLVDAGVALPRIDLIFITHLHSDHVLELGPLLHTAWTAGLAQRVRVFGPPGTRAVWDGFCQSMTFDIELRIIDEGRPDLRDLVMIEERGEGPVLGEGDLGVEALRVDHPPVDDCFALKFVFGGRSIVFSADTAYFPPLADFAREADILVHEAMHPAGVDRLVARTGNGARLRDHLMASHTLAADVGRLAASAQVRHLVLNHLVPADDPEITNQSWVEEVRKHWAGPLTVGTDGLEIALSGNA